MHRFEAVLEDCLEGLRSGRLTLEDCLSRYPRWAERLAPLLRVAASLGETFADEAADTAADPAFREEMRRRFLTVGAARPAPAPSTRYRWWASPLRLRAFATQPVMTVVLAFLVGFVGFSSFTVVTSADALPGDWRYPVKRAGEQARLTFTFDDGARRGLHISFAEERLSEVQRLAEKQRPIHSPVLRDLASATDNLDENLVSVPQQDIERIGVLAQKQQETLLAVEPLVEPEAKDDLQVALQTSGEVYDGAVHALALVTAPAGEEPPEAASEGTPEATSVATGEPTPEATPSAEAGATGTAEPAAVETDAPETTPTPEQDVGIESSATPPPEPTPVAAEPTVTPEPSPVGPGATPAAPEPSPPAPAQRVVFLPDDTTAGITWNLVTMGDFSLRVPAGAERDWAVSSLAVGDGQRIFVGHRWSNRFDAIVVVDVATGKASVHALIQGPMWRVEAEEIPSLVPDPVSSVIFHVLESINAGT